MRSKVVSITPLITDDKAIVSKLRVIYDDEVLFECFVLEQPWLNNAPYESCIPAGLYKMKLGIFQSGGYKAYEIHVGIPRSLVKMHIGNNVKDILGCIVPGDAIAQFDGEWNVLNSGTTFNKFMDIMDGDKEAWLSVSRFTRLYN
jgi:hypothetical protein